MKIIAHSRFSRLGLAGLGIILAACIIHAFTSSVADAQSAAVGKEVTYKVVYMKVNPNDPVSSASPVEAELNAYAVNGWHLVAIDRSLYIFSK